MLDKAKLAYLNSGQPIEDHFVDITAMIQVGKGAQRAVRTTLLSRYACYLAIQNADPGKPRHKASTDETGLGRANRSWIT